ncbi:hypothetical protein PFICI_08226 [Pestalotiopsis fici W106-1]|uniref:NAD(P)-binding protein n=1 Tax=Pestalotiopsis fici (strain W106-1 / CGMCC3.15140) TaxID=1229662 RepID=W3X5M5_PESFW|nr:uncharacterized protein PFICI_08226 [Pestalotiopsis fici W106-1]ETS80697.1 hypothetical protein PFICI_08226 [Pestalotiopsis fici W106-1]
MPSYVITGASRGLGFELLRQLSSNVNNTVVGLVRNKPAMEKKVSEELGNRPNVHVLQGDLNSYEELQKAAADTTTITNGSLDYLIANGAYVPQWDAYDPIGVLAQNPKKLEQELTKLYTTNIVGNINLYNLFLPLVLKGQAKKVVAITSSLANLPTVNGLGLEASPLYAIVKAGLNMVSAKFSAQYKLDGVLFVSICPGMVEAGHFDNLSPQQQATIDTMVTKFKAAIPDFSGASTPEVAMRNLINIWENASIENGDGGAFLSSRGTRY